MLLSGKYLGNLFTTESFLAKPLLVKIHFPCLHYLQNSRETWILGSIIHNYGKYCFKKLENLRNLFLDNLLFLSRFLDRFKTNVINVMMVQTIYNEGVFTPNIIEIEIWESYSNLLFLNVKIETFDRHLITCNKMKIKY